MNIKVDDLLSKTKFWQQEMRQLRIFMLDCGLVEELKWRQPCYTFNGKNIAIIGALKSHCVLGFFKGTLLSDIEKHLVSPGPNSQNVKQFKFDNLNQISSLEKTIKSYVFEAIEIEKAGLTVQKKKNQVLEYPDELISFFSSNPNFKEAFESLTPGRIKGYILFFSAAKQSITRTNRIKKYVERILNGKGMNDCICGVSKKMPNCDGSHKYI